MEPWMSWVVFLAIAGAVYWYYQQNSQPITRGRSATRSGSQSAPVWDEPEKKAKGAQKSKAKAPRKSVKSAVQEVGNKVEAALETVASNTGAGADDHPSPVASPVAVASSNKAPSGRDVSDMLGAKTAAPAVMSIKPSEKQNKSAKPQVPKTETAQESKKQRQNRKKNEEAKAAREAEEKERQALLEKQRRTAREARGEPAKNGLSQAQPPTNSPWTTVSRGGAVQPPTAASTSQLFDTFEASSPASVSDAPTNGTAPTAASYKDLPTEEEQVKTLLEDAAWETVPKGGKTKRKTLNEELLEENKHVGPVKAATQPAKPVRPTQALASETKKASSRYQILSEGFTKGHAEDSDWPVV
ncbi:hypothetical protein ACN47E_010046 [Coniothyrium glycines]